MNPKIAKNRAEKIKIKTLLEEFYSQRRHEYGVEKRKGDTFAPYVNLIASHTKSGGRVLDFGAGTGHSSLEISKKGFRTVGCDIFSAEAFQKSDNDLSLSPVDFVSYDGSNLPFEPESFDTVASLCVFEHIVFVEDALKEIHRVLKPQGRLIIQSPNWSGLNAPIRGIQSLVFKKDRYWQYESLRDAFCGIFRSFFWYFKVLFSRSDDAFIVIYPRIKEGKISFERSDDDCVHVCHPLSFKKWFKKNNYCLLRCDRSNGGTVVSRAVNTIFPSFATTNTFVGKKC